MIHILSQKKLSEDELCLLQKFIHFEIEYFEPFDISYLPLEMHIDPDNDILIFTSQHAVISASEYMAKNPKKPPCICIEGKTRLLAEKCEFKVLYSAYSAEDIIRIIHINRLNKRYIHLCSNDRLSTISEFFNNHPDFQFEEKVVYKKDLLFPMVKVSPDVLFALSPSGILALERAGLDKESVLVICIGKTTQKKAVELGYKKTLVSEKPGIKYMIQLLIDSKGLIKKQF